MVNHAHITLESRLEKLVVPKAQGFINGLEKLLKLINETVQAFLAVVGKV
jgi:hypothetical protein